MTVFKKSIKITSQSKFQIINITQSINEIVNESHIKEGIISIFSKHSTTAICINEDEIGLKEDFKTFIEKLVPNDKYKHDFIDNNAKSHLKSFLLSSSETIPITNGRMELGTWQSVFFVELDGPRTSRTIVITVVGDYSFGHKNF